MSKQKGETNAFTKSDSVTSNYFFRGRFCAVGFATVGFADEGDKGGRPPHGHHGGGPGMHMQYLSSSQLTSLAALNLTEEKWGSFWKATHECQRDAVKKSMPEKKSDAEPSKAERDTFMNAMKASFTTCFSSQLASSAQSK